MNSPRSPEKDAAPVAGLVVAALVGLLLRVWESWESSLWLDELHTLSHAAMPNLAAVGESVRGEYHTPLFFMAVHLLGAWEEGVWLRALPVVSSLVVLWPLTSLARAVSAGGSGARVVLLTVWLWACLPYQVHWATELRPYAWLTLFSAAAVYLAFAERGSRVVRFVLFFACVLLGLFTHRIMAVTVFSIGVARVLAPEPAGGERRRLGLGWLILAGALGVAPFVPWMLGFASQATTERFEYHEEVGGYTLRPALVKEVLALPMRVFVPYMGALGGAWALLAKAGALALFAALGVGGWLRLREGPAPGTNARLMRGLVAYVLAYFVSVTALAIYTWDRAPLQYYAGLGWLLPLVAAPLVVRRGWLAATAAAGVLAVGVAQAGGSCTEDMRGGIAAVREVAAELEARGEAPVFTALLSQPAVFDHVLPYRAYARDLEAVEPEAVPKPGEPGFERPVICLRRGLITYGNEKWAPLSTGRRVEREQHVDGYLTVFVLEPE